MSIQFEPAFYCPRIIDVIAFGAPQAFTTVNLLQVPTTENREGGAIPPRAQRCEEDGRS